MCSSCGGGSSSGIVVRSVATQKTIYKNEENCGITVDKLKELDIKVTKDLAKNKHSILYEYNKLLRTMIAKFKYIDVCSYMDTIKAIENAYAG